MPDKSSHTIALALRSIISLFGRPKIIQSDNGTKYVNEIIRKFTEVSGIDHRLMTTYHPRSNGKNDGWDLYLDSIQEALNNTPTALHDTRPFSLMLARRPNQFKDYSDVSIPTNYNETRKQFNGHITKFNNTVLPAIREKIKTSQTAAENKFNKSHRIIKEIPSGSQVMIKNINRTAKTDPLYIGNYTIVRKNQGGIYILVDGTGVLLPRNITPSHIKNRRNGQRNVEFNSSEERRRRNPTTEAVKEQEINRDCNPS
ncbi:hypothetical protein G6F37_011326 [Rhizopus arrhizus]|nr:hypothetical protein G6F38_011587 [Rhizopus arrhizus]KAG1149873.1 hypothetical protein G6F37_011326 [Rhizopus arrhizus]